MPGTVNGIGTMYYGSRNASSRPGVCEHCNNETMLQSYETGTYFTVLFVPLIPLGRKQILDYCPQCTWHRTISLQQWQTLQQETTEEATRRAHVAADDPEANLDLLGTLVSFRQEDEARKLADTMVTKFADNFDVQLALAVWHDESGREEPAHECFRRALDLQPDHPGVRRAVAVGCIQRGLLNEAKSLLEFMLEPDAEREPLVLVMLADAYQVEGAHREALEYYELALHAHPPLGKDKDLRRRIAASEEAAGSETNMLPELPWRPGRLTVVWAVAAVVLIAAFGINYYVKSHQTVHLVNRLDAPVTVTIDDQAPRKVGTSGVDKVSLAEGTHRAVFTGTDGDEQTFEFQLENGLFQRYLGKSVFVVNLGSAANLLWEETEYSANPDPTATAPYQIHFGENFFVLRDIDYAFREFPPELKTESRRLKKTRVSVLDYEPAAVLAAFPDGTPVGEKMRFAETHLARHGNDEQLLGMYVYFATLADKSAECRSFLETGLARRPVQIEWHRTYQEVCKAAGDQAQVREEYDDLLEKDPGNSALLYLRGRVAGDPKLAESFFDRAIEADPENAYPLLAKAYRRVAQADFAAADPLLSKAARLKPDSLAVAGLFFETRLALGRFDELHSELLKLRQAFPLDFHTHEQLLQVAVVEGDPEKARRLHNEYAGTVKAMQQPVLAVRSRIVLNYLLGNLNGFGDACAELHRLLGTAEEDTDRFAIFLETGELERAEEVLESEGRLQTGTYALLLSFAWDERGDATKSATWRQRAVEAFQTAAEEEKRIARALQLGDTVRMEDIEDFVGPRDTMAVTLVALAGQSPALRRQLLAKAEKLNIVSRFPYQFLKRTIDSRKSADTE